jgi:hypothetical protein
METATYVVSERERHYRLAAIIHIAYACIGLLAGLIGTVLLLGLSTLSNLQGSGLSELVILRVLAYAAIAITLLTTLPALIGGIGLLKKQPWARILLMIVAVFDLFAFPLGTAIGVYTLWALWEPLDWQRA